MYIYYFLGHPDILQNVFQHRPLGWGQRNAQITFEEGTSSFKDAFWCL